MSETVQIALFGFLGIALGGILTAIPQWLRARSETQASELKARTDAGTAERAAIEKANTDTFTRINESQTRQDARTIRLEGQVDSLRDELASAMAQIATLTKQLDEEKSARNPLNAEIAALKEKVTGLEAIVTKLEELVTQLRSQIAKGKQEAGA